jgi:GAF domain-containing protein
MQCPRCQHENRRQAKFCEECATPLKAAQASAPHPSPLGDITAALSEARAQQTATAAILRVMSGSPTDLHLVFDAILQSATQLCAGFYSLLFLRNGEELDIVATHNVPPEGVEALKGRYPLSMASDEAGLTARAVRERRPQHVADIQTEPGIPEAARRASEAVGQRAGVAVPLLREGEAIGALTVSRQEAKAFSQNELTLLQTFAAQAVIAIENVRLFTELQQKNKALTESLEQQTATAEVLKAISRSTFDLQPVLDTLLENAVRLGDAQRGVIDRRDGDVYRGVAFYNVSPELVDYSRNHPITPGRHTITARVALERRTIHVADVQADPDYTYATRDVVPIRTILGVPMLRGNDILGVIILHKLEVRPFTDKQIELVQTFADQAVIAIENVRLFSELQASNRELTTALDQQTATSDILRAISASPVDVQPVFEAIARNSVRLCNGVMGAVFRFDGEFMHVGALHGFSADGEDATRRTFPMRPERRMIAARAVLSRAIVQVPDVMADRDFDYAALATTAGWRSLLVVPMLRKGEVLGTVGVGRAQIGLFRDQEVALLQTFADQAVIAIENVRLFKELKEKNGALTEALEQQTATSEILRVISSSPTDLQPVFDMVVRNAATLCDAAFGGLHRIDSDRITLDAQHGVPADELIILQRDVFPIPISRESATGRAILDQVIVHIHDIREDPGFRMPRVKTMENHRTILAVPMLREGVPLGALALWRREVLPFSETEIGLVRTFADQAVIAIENVRLFTELQEKNQALTQAHAQVTEALDQQTATSEILKVISSSPTDVQPVFDAIAESAMRLCDASVGGVLTFDGELVHLAGMANIDPAGVGVLRGVFPMAPSRRSASARAILTREVANIPDVLAEPDYGVAQQAAAAGFRSIVSVPMLREGRVLGAVTSGRATPGPFTDKQIALLQMFADQAVIAIENVRLFKELQARTGELTRSVGELRALGEVSQALSSTLDVDVVLDTIVTRANDLIGADGCTIFEYDEITEQFNLRATRNLEPRLVELARGTPLRKGDQGILGHLPIGRQPVQVPDITAGSYSSPISDALMAAGYRAVIAVPLTREDHLIGALTMNRKTPGEFPAETIELLQNFATQSALAIQNARLFREIADKSRQLEAASRHKSEFLANMSHELRTPLNAVIGFSEVLLQQMFGDLNPKQDEYLKDIYASGQHLLSLINDILDLSKIEAGKMELEVTDFDLPSAIDNALILVRERATRRGITLGQAIDNRVGVLQGDERKVKQVLLNLLSNAIKFTPEGGRIEARAAVREGLVEVSVTDTGVGIAPEDQEAVFEEFRQVGTADKKVEGTGLGLTLCRKFVALHGGRIWVKSQVGQGSTFTFTLPVRRER